VLLLSTGIRKSKPQRSYRDEKAGMADQARSPILIRGIGTTRYFVRFLFDPLAAIQQSYRKFGTFAAFKPPILSGKYNKIIVVAIGSQFNQEVLDHPLIWRTIGIGPGGDKKSASRRLGRGLISAQGDEHKHYRQLLLPPLRRKSVDAQSIKIGRIAAKEVETWPLNQTIDLWACVQKLLRAFAISLLFGDDHAHGSLVAELTLRWFSNNRHLCPVNVPGTRYNRMLRDGEALERHILDWAACKRDSRNDNDLFGVLVNNPDERGQPASDTKIVGHMPTIFGASIGTCQSVLIWTLILLAQHPQIARYLLDEVNGQLAGATPTLDRINDLPLLTAVVKESMRILPPVPQQFRIAQEDTTLANFPVTAKTRVLLSPFLTNRDPDLYREPDRFKPERWASIDPSPYEYLVFSAGPRSCPGYWFGFAVLKVALPTILTRYRVVLAPNTRINYNVNVTMTPRGKILATLRRQDGAFVASPIQGSIRKLVRFPD
jgi:cytochrome P450